MKTYRVAVPIKYYLTVEVRAESEEDAIDEVDGVLLHDIANNPKVKALERDEAYDPEHWDIQEIKPAVSHTVETTEKFWDCECDIDFIHPKIEINCSKCGAIADDQPDSRVMEVAVYLELHPELKQYA